MKTVLICSLVICFFHQELCSQDINLPFPTFADIDADGDFDLILGEGDGKLTLYRNIGTSTNPSLHLEDDFFGSIDVGYDSAPTFADIDNDNDLDLFIGNDAGTIYFYRNIGKVAVRPDFDFITNNYESIRVPSFSYPAFVDIDNDSELYLFVGHASGDTACFYFYRNNGSVSEPIFSLESNRYQSLDVGGIFSTPVFVDIDNDGDLDLFSRNGSYGALLFFRNIGSATEATFSFVTNNFVDGKSGKI